MKKALHRGFVATKVTIVLWALWILLAWSIPAVAQYTPPPGCGNPCKMTVLRIKSGTTLTIQDAQGNAGPVLTDAGTTIDTVLDGNIRGPRYYVNSLNEYIEAPGAGEMQFYAGGVENLRVTSTYAAAWAGLFKTNDLRALTAAGPLTFQDSAGNQLGRFLDSGTVGALILSSSLNATRWVNPGVNGDYVDMPSAGGVDLVTTLSKPITFTTTGTERFRASDTGLQIGSGTGILDSYAASYTIDFASQGPLTCQESSQTLTNAAVGDGCVLGQLGAAPTAAQYSCYVSATNTVVIKECCINGAAGTCNAVSGSYSVRVFDP